VSSKERESAKSRDALAQKFEALAGKIGELNRQAGEIAARSRKTRNQTAADGVRQNHRHNRDRRGSLLCREARPSRREDDIGLELDKLGGNLGETLVAPIRPPILDCHGTPIDPA